MENIVGLANELADTIPPVLVEGWKLLLAEFCSRGSWHPPHSATPSLSHSSMAPQQSLRGSSEDTICYPNSSCHFTFTLNVAAVHLWEKSVWNHFLHLLQFFLHWWKILHETAEAMYTSWFASLDVTVLKNTTEMVLYWLLLFDRKKKKSHILWMSINIVWELWIIRDIMFPADVFVP